MSCKFDVEKVVSIYGGIITETFIDHRTSPSTLIDQATYDALSHVKCPEVNTDVENLCIQPIGNTDSTLIEQGFQCITKTVTYDAADVATVAIESVTLHQSDGTDVTATYEVAEKPQAIITSVKSCVA